MSISCIIFIIYTNYVKALTNRSSENFSQRQSLSRRPNDKKGNGPGNEVDLVIELRRDHNKKDGSMYISPECIAGIKQKRLKNDARKTCKDIKHSTK